MNDFSALQNYFSNLAKVKPSRAHPENTIHNTLGFEGVRLRKRIHLTPEISGVKHPID